MPDVQATQPTSSQWRTGLFLLRRARGVACAASLLFAMPPPAQGAAPSPSRVAAAAAPTPTSGHPRPRTPLHDAKRARKSYFQGLELMGAGDVAGAIAAFKQTIDSAPDWALAYLELGTAENLYEPGGENARAALARAAKLDPRNARAHYQLGLAYKRAGLLSEAAASLSTALKLRSDLIDAWFHFGSVLQAAKDDVAAERALAGVLQRDPNHLGALAALAEVEERQGHLDVAETALMRIAALQPQIAYHQYQLAQFYERIGQPDKAKAAFARAEMIDPLPKRRMRRLR